MLHFVRNMENDVFLNTVLTTKEKRKLEYTFDFHRTLNQQLLNSGKQFYILHIDLVNITSKKIYRNIGYEQVSDSKNYIFCPP